ATSSTASIVLGLGSNPGNATLSGTATLTATSGEATASDLSLEKAGAGYTIVASSAGLQGVTSGPFSITPAAAAQLAFTQQPPASWTAGAAIAAPVLVQVQDRFTNAV